MQKKKTMSLHCLNLCIPRVIKYGTQCKYKLQYINGWLSCDELSVNMLRDIF